MNTLQENKMSQIINENMRKISESVQKIKQEEVVEEEFLNEDDLKVLYIINVIENVIQNNLSDDTVLLDAVDVLSTAGIKMNHPQDAISQIIGIVNIDDDNINLDENTVFLSMGVCNANIANLIESLFNSNTGFTVKKTDADGITLSCNEKIFKSNEFKDFLEKWFEEIKLAIDNNNKAKEELEQDSSAKYKSLTSVNNLYKKYNM